jgi:hypothetical protein
MKTMRTLLPPGVKSSQRRCAVIAAIVAGASVAGVTFAAPALAVHLEQYIEVPQCQPATSEDCPQIPAVTFSSVKGEGLQAQFTANANHCSDIFVRFLLDGYPQSDWIRVGPGQTTPQDPGFVSPGGTHSLGVAARGILGGCNATGVLSAWGGTVRIDSVGGGVQPPTHDQRDTPPFGQIPDDPSVFVLPH